MPTASAEPIAATFFNPRNVDPFKLTYVVAHNREFTGESVGVDFSRGVARIDALPKGAPAEKVQKRIDQLTWFLNAHPVRIGPRTHVPAYTFQDEAPAEPEDEEDAE